jgi:hypothetical protein
MGENFINLDSWNTYAQMLAGLAMGVGVFIMIYHVVRLGLIKDYKQKYDYINLKEIQTLWVSSIFLIIGLGMLANTLFVSEFSVVWFGVRLFTTIMLGLIVGVVVSNVLRFYYPFYVEKRLKELRYKPRVSPQSGKLMKLLSEEEEDVYLDEGMQVEENVFSVDYDVWIDEETGYTKIEKYAGHLHALQCPECRYQTLKVMKEEILESPSVSEEGQLMKFFKCDYCEHKERKVFRIARLRETKTDEASSPVTT